MSTNNSNNHSSSSNESQGSNNRINNPWAKQDEERLGRPFDPTNNMDRLRVLRMEFCPASMVNEDGTIHQEYFRSKKLASEWSDLENLVLLKSVMEYGAYGSKEELGMDAWRKIVAKWLPQRTFIEVRFQLAKVFGIQDLSCYEDVKFACELQIKRELKKNKQLAKQYGTWKYGTSMRVLSEDMQAIVEKRKEEEKERQRQKKKIDDMRAAEEMDPEEEEQDENIINSKSSNGVVQKQDGMQREKKVKKEEEEESKKEESDVDIEMDENGMDTEETGRDDKREGKGKIDKSKSGKKKKQKTIASNSSKKVLKELSGKKSGKKAKNKSEQVKNQPKINAMFKKLVVDDSELSKNEKKDRNGKIGNDGDDSEDDDLML